MKTKTTFVATFTCLFFVGYALLWYALSLLSALTYYGNLPQAVSDYKFHLTAITDIYEMTTRLIAGVGLGLLVWTLKKKAHSTIAG